MAKAAGWPRNTPLRRLTPRGRAGDGVGMLLILTGVVPVVLGMRSLS